MVRFVFRFLFICVSSSSLVGVLISCLTPRFASTGLDTQCHVVSVTPKRTPPTTTTNHVVVIVHSPSHRSWRSLRTLPTSQANFRTWERMRTRDPGSRLEVSPFRAKYPSDVTGTSPSETDLSKEKSRQGRLRRARSAPGPAARSVPLLHANAGSLGRTVQLGSRSSLSLIQNLPP